MRKVLGESAAANVRAPWRRLSARNALWVALVALLAIAEFASAGAFLKPRNLVNILAQNSVAGALTIGQTLVILTGGIDLSLGSLTALTSEVVLSLQRYGVFWARSAGLGVGMGCGLITGLLVTVGRVPPFIATLGMMQAALGLAYVVSSGYPIYETDHMPLIFGMDQIGSVPLIVVVWLALAALGWLFLKRTRYGAYVYAVGGNERAARVSGVNTGRVKLLVYVIAGACAAVAGMLLVDRLGYTQPTVGVSLTLDSIAPVVVGGTSLFGGVGGIWLTVGGVLVMGTLNNLMVIVGVGVYVEQIIEGLIILLVVYGFSRYQQK
jgi:ribose/xylose/arabinose/galactoside ABC-type transport system permease subunit